MIQPAPSSTDRRAPAATRPVCLPMYDLPEVRADNDALWRHLREALAERGFRGLPDNLCRDVDPHAAWVDPRLLLAQTCGYPFASRLKDRVRLVATPCYDVPGCSGPRYRSWLIARDDDHANALEDFRDRRLVINTRDSLSGCKVLEMMLPPGASLASYFSAALESGAHGDSITTVAEGGADLAAIDCVTWELLRRHRPAHLEGVRIVDSGPLLPALPMITGAHTSDAELDSLRLALAATLESAALAATRRRLGLGGIARVDAGDYLSILARLPGERP